MLTSVTLVVVMRAKSADIDLIRQASARLSQMFHDVETVLVAIAVAPDVALDLKAACNALPDCTLLFVGDEVHDDIARLIGIDHAMSDYVLFATPMPSEIDALPQVVAALRQGNDLVVGVGQGGMQVQRGAVEAGLFLAFRWVYRLITGRVYEATRPTFRMYSRAAALFIATRNDGEVLVRAAKLGNGFPSIEVPVLNRPPVAAAGTPLRMAVGKAVRLLLTGSALPLRLASYVGLLGGVGSIFYAGYVLLVYSFKSNVEPGWTTLSLQLSGMMFVMSIQFVFLSEYVVQILSSSPVATRRSLVIREIRGMVSARSGRLNVVNQDGHFQLGAPAPMGEAKVVS